MEEKLNGRQTHWKTTLIEDDINGRRHQWKTTSMDNNTNRRQTQWKTISLKDGLNRRQPEWKMPSMEDALNGNNTSIEDYLNLTQWKPYRKQITFVSLASKFSTELGPAQPQLV